MFHLGKESQICAGNMLIWIVSSGGHRFLTLTPGRVQKPRREEEEEQAADQVVSCRMLDNSFLFSGFWGLARHRNYVFELLLALSWRSSIMSTFMYPLS